MCSRGRPPQLEVRSPLPPQGELHLPRAPALRWCLWRRSGLLTLLLPAVSSSSTAAAGRVPRLPKFTLLAPEPAAP